MDVLLHDWRTWTVIAYTGFCLSLYHLTMAGYLVSFGDEEKGLFHDRHRPRRRLIYLYAGLGLAASIMLFSLMV